MIFQIKIIFGLDSDWLKEKRVCFDWSQHIARVYEPITDWAQQTSSTVRRKLHNVSEFNFSRSYATVFVLSFFMHKSTFKSKEVLKYECVKVQKYQSCDKEPKRKKDG